MLLIAEPYQAMFAALGLNSFDSITAAFGTPPRADRESVKVEQSVIARAGGPPVPVFFKQYFYPRPSLAFWGRASKAHCEFRHYGVFMQADVRCAERIACGEKRDRFGRLRHAFIITRTVPDAATFIGFMSSTPPSAASRTVQLRRNILRQLARMTRRSHDAGFYHRDLYGRNVLVTETPEQGPLVWWIDCPRGVFDRWSPWRRRSALKDLASLDKSASKHCSRSERLAFIQEYLAKPALDADAKKWIRDALDYRRQRWPEDWNEN